jgi:uncharacterized protein
MSGSVLGSIDRPAALAAAGAWLTVRAVDDGRVICARVKPARSFAARLVGLIGRRGLAADEGLYLAGTNSVHMLFMRFPIDCIFLSPTGADGTRRVTAIRHNLRPWTGVVWYVGRTEGVIELPAGSVARSGVQVGDVVRLEATIVD